MASVAVFIQSLMALYARIPNYLQKRAEKRHRGSVARIMAAQQKLRLNLRMAGPQRIETLSTEEPISVLSQLSETPTALPAPLPRRRSLSAMLFNYSISFLFKLTELSHRTLQILSALFTIVLCFLWRRAMLSDLNETVVQSASWATVKTATLEMYGVVVSHLVSLGFFYFNMQGYQQRCTDLADSKAAIRRLETEFSQTRSMLTAFGASSPANQNAAQRTESGDRPSKTKHSIYTH